LIAHNYIQPLVVSIPPLTAFDTPAQFRVIHVFNTNAENTLSGRFTQPTMLVAVLTPIIIDNVPQIITVPATSTE